MGIFSVPSSGCKSTDVGIVCVVWSGFVVEISLRDTISSSGSEMALPLACSAKFTADQRIVDFWNNPTTSLEERDGMGVRERTADD